MTLHKTISATQGFTQAKSNQVPSISCRTSGQEERRGSLVIWHGPGSQLTQTLSTFHVTGQPRWTSESKNARCSLVIQNHDATSHPDFNTSSPTSLYPPTPLCIDNSNTPHIDLCGIFVVLINRSPSALDYAPASPLPRTIQHPATIFRYSTGSSLIHRRNTTFRTLTPTTSSFPFVHHVCLYLHRPYRIDFVTHSPLH